MSLEDELCSVEPLNLRGDDIRAMTQLCHLRCDGVKALMAYNVHSSTIGSIFTCDDPLEPIIRKDIELRKKIGCPLSRVSRACDWRKL